jgi:hypothetical protein
MPTEIISPEVECLKLKAAINENWRLAQKFAANAIERALLAGELLFKWKELLPHGQFEAFVEKHFDGSLSTAQVYMKAVKGLRALPKAQQNALLSTEDSLNGLISRLKKDDSPKIGGPIGHAAKSISEKGKPGGADSAASSRQTPVSSGPVAGEAADSSGEDERTDSEGSEPVKETDPRPPRSGKDKPGTGTCPCCAGKKWSQDEFGFTCAKCHHPWGEPADRQPEEQQDRPGELRAKTIKTVEALMRCLDDLNIIIPKAGSHKQSIDLCKSILKTAKSWN